MKQKKRAKQKLDRVQKIGIGIYMTISLGAILLGVWFHVDSEQFFDKALSVTATMVDYEIKQKHFDSDRDLGEYDFTITYIYQYEVAGREYEGRYGYDPGSRPPLGMDKDYDFHQYHPGEQVEVFYLPGHPEDARLPGQVSGRSIVCFIIGGMLLIWALLILYRARK